MAIRVGIGGWTFEPWRGTFFPEGLKQAKELEFASRAVTSIEINGTFYRGQTPKTYKSWADQVPEGFVFALKATRFCTHRRILAEAGESVARFVDGGIAEMGEKLGPINWQFPPTKAFDPDDFGAFLALLPESVGGVKLRHAVEVRHESFCTADFIALATKHKVAIIYADKPGYPAIPDITADFVYARLQDAKEEVETGYEPKALDHWAARAKSWAEGKVPKDMKPISGKAPAKGARDVFVYMINGAKVRAPAAAQALLERVC
ncbi:DUF72 domain-containing protein [Roseixanthobacter pseudopolyaromaticivorans]|uniref:DUF72 domain-containing protein n=1 Tax=Xanthobacteraceae TaxID=335928 RepID=UPI0037282742